MFYLFHGEDEFSRAEAVQNLKQRMDGDPAMVDLNTAILDGRKITLGELRHACDTIPFLADRRLVIVEGLLGALSAQEKRRSKEILDELVAYLPHLPPTTRLILVENRRISQKHPVYQLALAEECGHVQEFVPPRQNALPRWITKRAERHGGQITPPAAGELAAFVGNDLRLLDQELAKLVAYTGGERPISVDDVHLLVSYAQEANVFHMVDALGRRDGRTAMRLLHQLLDKQKPLALLGMIVRQFRILVQVKELSERGLGQREITDKLKLHSFVVEKGLRQARNFSMAQLEKVYDQLVETDVAIKTGRLDPVLALDLLVAGLSRTR
ncbi:MAG: DNA polymerase III subunit delta [Chloroflexi bacterium]|nr:MAG: DNA polymerase III subunit delta [Chloroflexota bacterium]